MTPTLIRPDPVFLPTKRWKYSSTSVHILVANYSNCNSCSHIGQHGKGKVRTQHLRFERSDGPSSSKIRGMSRRIPLRVATLEELFELRVGKQSVAGKRRKSFPRFTLYAALDPYEVLGVPSTATDKEIKQAYRKLALKVHPDVNKEPDAQQQFLRVKNAYQTLSDDSSRAKYDASKRGSPSWDPFGWESERKSAQKEEEFYGFEDFFRDLQADSRRQASKPKSLWEELADIGEEFVEFLEKELNISETMPEERQSSDYEASNDKRRSDTRDAKKKPEGFTDPRDEEAEKRQVENEIAEVEDMLAQLKKELGI